jgi:hypothetical protein
MTAPSLLPIDEVVRRLRRTRGALRKTDLLSRLAPRPGPHGRLLHPAALVAAWEKALIRYDGLRALRGCAPVPSVAQAPRLPADHDGQCPVCRRAAVVLGRRAWCPVCGITQIEWTPP